MYQQSSSADQIEKMNVIVNIRTMQEKIDGVSKPFDILNRYKLSELRSIQENLIPYYNKSINSSNQNQQ